MFLPLKLRFCSPRLLWLALLLAAMSLSAPAEEAPLTRAQVVEQFHQGRARLNQRFWSPTLNIWLDRTGDDLRANYEGRLNPPWWPSANAVEVLLDFVAATGERDDLPVIEKLYELQKNRPAREERVVAELKKRHQWSEADDTARAERLAKRAAAPPPRYYTDFQNEYLDDSGWWALTWLKLYAQTSQPRFLATARALHAHIARNWSPEKGGGILWCEDADKQRPNTISNTLFLILSARLYQTTHDIAYLAAADKTLAWLHEQALYDGTAVVDGPGHHGDYWSYNQGTFLGGLTALSLATGRADYLEEAARMAETILHRSGLVLPSGVLVEKLGTGGDASVFKGIFVRYLGQLREALHARGLHPELVQEIDHLLQASAASLLKHGTGPEGFFFPSWQEGGKPHDPSFNAQVAGLALLVGALPPK